ncbi:uncharacterized protein RBU33_022660 isoform 1-T1 [Hipposideros larvatus]
MKNRESQIFLEAQPAFNACVRTKDAAPPGVRLAVGASELRRRPAGGETQGPAGKVHGSSGHIEELSHHARERMKCSWASVRKARNLPNPMTLIFRSPAVGDNDSHAVSSPCGEELRPTAITMSELSWERILQPQLSLQMTAALADILTSIS